jgi:probable F420-dependent oxidoreductase
VKFAVTFGRLNPAFWLDAAVLADDLGFESIWLPEHLVFPLEMRGQLIPGEEHPPVPASTPVYDAAAYLSFIAARTTQIRLGTFVYLLGIRHPFVGARAFATLDIVSGGRAEVGVGAGWLVNEWEAVGLDPRTRGRRFEEAITVCKRLWTEDVIEHHGEFFDFAPVMFEPKPVQKPHPPVLVGGESDRALERAARLGEGWIGMAHTPDTVSVQVKKLRELLRSQPAKPNGFTITCSGLANNSDDKKHWEDAGVDRLIVTPWKRSPDALDGMKRFAEAML